MYQRLILIKFALTQVGFSLASLAKLSIGETINKIVPAVVCIDQWFDCHLPDCGGFTEYFPAGCDSSL